MPGGPLRAVAGRYQQPSPTSDLAAYRGAAFGDVEGVAYDGSGGLLYLSERSAHRIQVVTLNSPQDAASWTMATLAGDGQAGFSDAVSKHPEPVPGELRPPQGLGSSNRPRRSAKLRRDLAFRPLELLCAGAFLRQELLDPRL